jgi:hypothetical protein
MGIKHSVTKSTGQKGYASEWNADHVIDGDVDANGKKITNLGTPTENTDAATKKYVDDKVLIESSINTAENVEIGDVPVNVITKTFTPSKSGKVLIIGSCEFYGDVYDPPIEVKMWIDKGGKLNYTERWFKNPYTGNTQQEMRFSMETQALENIAIQPNTIKLVAQGLNGSPYVINATLIIIVL